MCNCMRKVVSEFQQKDPVVEDNIKMKLTDKGCEAVHCFRVGVGSGLW